MNPNPPEYNIPTFLRPWLPTMPAHTRREKIIASVLFLFTLATTTLAGTLQSLPPEAAAHVDVNSYASISATLIDYWYVGLPFSLTLLLILATHEFGHFFLAKRHRMHVSLPFFIPAPTLIGTFGAVIRMKGPIWHRHGLMDVGAAGPMAGMLVALPAYLIGLSLSTPVSITAANQAGLSLGDSLLTLAAQWIIWGDLGPGVQLMLHPIAFAGWIGFFVTCLNLIPVAQLDGGHILYALTPKWYPWIAKLSLFGLIIFGFVGWSGWLFWALIAFVMGVDKHPPTVYHEFALSPRRRLIGVANLLLFCLTFSPNPFGV